MSTKQMAATVRFGRKVTFHTSIGKQITGYLCGMDDYHWMVVTPELQVLLVHKAAPLVMLHDEASYESESRYAELEKFVAPFRTYLAEE